MKAYDNYSIDDFITDADFISWVLGNGEEPVFNWTKWVRENPDKENIVKQARLIILSLRVNEYKPNENDIQYEVVKIQDLAMRKRSLVYRMGASWWKYAAVFLIILVSAAVMGRLAIRKGKEIALAGIKGQEDIKDLLEQDNNGDSTRQLILEDGSAVVLSPHSAVRFSRHLLAGESRDIYLSGQAFFQVVKNQQKPFRVFSNELIIKVLGTSFTIRAGSGDNVISVVVNTGKVSVYKNEKSNDGGSDKKQLTGVLLTPNQELVYSRDEHKFQKMLLERPKMVDTAVIRNNFQYDEANVTNVLEDLKKAFALGIVYDKEGLKNCKITADLSNESIYVKLSVICKALNAKYEIIDGQVIIQSSVSCQ